MLTTARPNLGAAGRRGRARAGWRRSLVTALVALVALTSPLAGCDPNPDAPCAAAYEHLLSLGRRNHDPELQLRFVKACSEAFDANRVDCLRAATSAEEALACESTKKRPG